MVDAITLPEVTIVGEVPKVFAAMDDAALDALRRILPTSLKENREYSGPIYQQPGAGFYWITPEPGEKDSSTTDFSSLDQVVPSHPLVAIFHTHPKVNNNYMNFSGQDMVFVVARKLVLYMGTDNVVKKLIPRSLLPADEQANYPFGFKQVTLTSHAL